MNTNEVYAKTGARLKRIKIVSVVFRILLGLYVVALVLCAASCMKSGMPRNPIGPQALTYFLHHLFIKPSPMPVYVVLSEIIRLGLYVYGLSLLNHLFVLFGRGKFFTAENVRCIRWIGLVIALDAFAVFLDLLANRQITLGVQWLIGLFVVLLSWIADEGRRIQEEQELTV